MQHSVKSAALVSHAAIEPARTGRSRKSKFASVILFALAFGSVAFATWYSDGSIEATTEIPMSAIARDPGTALAHPTGGIVAQVLVREGQKVKAGDTLLVLDGGKITAPTDGAIVELEVLAPGDVIHPGAKVLGIVPMPVLALHT